MHSSLLGRVSRQGPLWDNSQQLVSCKRTGFLNRTEMLRSNEYSYKQAGLPNDCTQLRIRVSTLGFVFADSLLPVVVPVLWRRVNGIPEIPTVTNKNMHL